MKDNIDDATKGNFNFSNKCFVLENAVLTDDEAAKLCDFLIANSTVTEIVLKGNNISYKALNCLSRVLQNHPNIRSIVLNNNTLSSAEIDLLTSVIANNKIIRSYDLSKNNISLEDIKHIAPPFKNNQTVERLILAENLIGDAGMIFLSDALKDNTSITYLNLNQNYINDEGANSLAVALNGRSSIVTLELNDNLINVEGAGSLASLIESSANLVELSLAENPIGDQGAVALLEAITKNRSIIKLDISKTDISEENESNIQNQLVRNNELVDNVLEQLAKKSNLEEAINKGEEFKLKESLSLRFHKNFESCKAACRKKLRDRFKDSYICNSLNPYDHKVKLQEIMTTVEENWLSNFFKINLIAKMTHLPILNNDIRKLVASYIKPSEMKLLNSHYNLLEQAITTAAKNSDIKELDRLLNDSKVKHLKPELYNGLIQTTANHQVRFLLDKYLKQPNEKAEGRS